MTTGQWHFQIVFKGGNVPETIINFEDETVIAFSGVIANAFMVHKFEKTLLAYRNSRPVGVNADSGVVKVFKAQVNPRLKINLHAFSIK